MCVCVSVSQVISIQRILHGKLEREFPDAYSCKIAYSCVVCLLISYRFTPHPAAKRIAAIRFDLEEGAGDEEDDTSVGIDPDYFEKPASKPVPAVSSHAQATAPSATATAASVPAISSSASSSSASGVVNPVSRVLFPAAPGAVAPEPSSLGVVGIEMLGAASKTPSPPSSLASSLPTAAPVTVAVADFTPQVVREQTPTAAAEPEISVVSGSPLKPAASAEPTAAPSAEPLVPTPEIVATQSAADDTIATVTETTTTTTTNTTEQSTEQALSTSESHAVSDNTIPADQTETTQPHAQDAAARPESPTVTPQLAPQDVVAQEEAPAHLEAPSEQATDQTQAEVPASTTDAGREEVLAVEESIITTASTEENAVETAVVTAVAAESGESESPNTQQVVEPVPATTEPAAAEPVSDVVQVETSMPVTVQQPEQQEALSNPEPAPVTQAAAEDGTGPTPSTVPEAQIADSGAGTTASASTQEHEEESTRKESSPPLDQGSSIPDTPSSAATEKVYIYM